MDIDPGFDFMPTSNNRQVVEPFPSFFVKYRRQDVPSSECDAAAHRTDTRLRTLTIRKLFFSLRRSLDAHFVDQPGREHAGPRRGERTVRHFNRPVVAEGHACDCR